MVLFSIPITLPISHSHHSPHNKHTWLKQTSGSERPSNTWHESVWNPFPKAIPQDLYVYGIYVTYTNFTIKIHHPFLVNNGQIYTKIVPMGILWGKGSLGNPRCWNKLRLLVPTKSCASYPFHTGRGPMWATTKKNGRNTVGYTGCLIGIHIYIYRYNGLLYLYPTYFLLLLVV